MGECVNARVDTCNKLIVPRQVCVKLVLLSNSLERCRVCERQHVHGVGDVRDDLARAVRSTHDAAWQLRLAALINVLLNNVHNTIVPATPLRSASRPWWRCNRLDGRAARYLTPAICARRGNLEQRWLSTHSSIVLGHLKCFVRCLLTGCSARWRNHDNVARPADRPLYASACDLASVMRATMQNSEHAPCALNVNTKVTCVAHEMGLDPH
jgi:hypothetical protein